MKSQLNKSRLCLTFAAVASGLLLAGCETVKQANIAVDKTTDAIQAATKRAEDEKTPVISHTKSAWLMGQTVVVTQPDSPILLQKISFGNPDRKFSLGDIAAYISQNFGLLVDVSEVTGNNGLSIGTAVSGAATPNAGLTPSAALLPPPPAFLANAASSSISGARGVPDISVSYEGTIKGLLDVMAAKAGVWWRFEDGRVEFFRTLTKTVYMPALARKATGKSTIVESGGASSGISTGQMGATSGSGGDSASTGSSTFGSSYDIDIWKAIENSAKAVAGATGGSGAIVVASESLGGLTVTGTPAQVRRVEEWARNLADNLSQMVKIGVTVYTVTLNNEDNVSFTPDVAFNRIGSAFGMNLAGVAGPAVAGATSAGSITAKILESSTNSLRGSDLMFKALSTLGKVSTVKKWSTVALNGQVANVQMAQETTYAAQAGVTSTANVGTSSTITPATITTGVTGSIQPRIVNGKITLAMDMKDSNLISITPFTSGGVTVQQPKTTRIVLPSSISLKPGSSLIATTIQQDSGSVTKNGSFVPDNPLLGGGTGATTAQQLVVVDISAEVM